MNLKREKIAIVAAGLVIGIIASLLVLFGNPANMGFCIACFLRDTAGGLGLHRAAAVQYIRPEIIGLVLGSFIMAACKKEFSPKGGSAPLTRFILGFFAMIGCLMFLGCPFRMILRMAGGDLNALLGLLGFVIGILCGVFFLKKGYSLKRTYRLPKLEGAALSIIQLSGAVEDEVGDKGGGKDGRKAQQQLGLPEQNDVTDTAHHAKARSRSSSALSQSP
mgnify:CR=1 FL=1